MQNERVNSSTSSIFVGIFIWLVLSVCMFVILSLYLNIPKYEWLLSISLSVTVTSPVFIFGLFTTRVRHQAVVMRLKKRTGRILGEGYCWLLPGIYSHEEVDVRDMTVDLGEKHFLSQDNVPVTADSAVVTRITSGVKYLNFAPEGLSPLIGNLMEEAVRLYILRHRAMSLEVFSGRRETSSGGADQKEESENNPPEPGLDQSETGTQQAPEMTEAEIEQRKREQIAKFKSDVMSNGRTHVKEQVQLELDRYGMEVVRVIIENIRLPESIEKAGAEHLREQLESRGDEIDWDNTVNLAGRTLAVLKETLGEKAFENLDPERKARLVESFVDQILAKKKQATRISTSGDNLLSSAALLRGTQNE